MNQLGQGAIFHGIHGFEPYDHESALDRAEDFIVAVNDLAAALAALEGSPDA